MTPIRTVLCPVDFSASSRRELALATQICQRTGARLVLHHDLESVPPPCLGAGWMWSESHASEEQAKQAHAERVLAELMGQLPPGLTVESKISKAPLGDSILYLADRLPSDLIVMATHDGRTPDHEPVTERIVLRARCPVLTTRDAGDRIVLPDLGPRCKNRIPVLVPIDGTEHALRALHYAFELGDFFPFDFELLCVEGRICWDDLRHGTRFNVREHREQRLESARQRLHEMIPIRLEPRTRVAVRLGPAAGEILRHAQERGIQLILLGLHAKSVWARLLSGATSCEILHQSICPVWFVSEVAARHSRRPIAELATAATA
ncbi:MAG TPA: universal stress protein [Acidobacteriota bacterium]